jgi:NarL family two-component system response regulator YdfI
VVDDHLVVREGLRLILESEPGLEWVGEAEDGAALLVEVEKVGLDVVLMDVRIPGMGGLQALRHLKKIVPEVGVVMLAIFDEEDQLISAVRGGARGYLLKDAGRDTILETVLAAADKPTVGTTLTRREEQVLRALAEGASNKSIARRLDTNGP